MNYDTYFDTLFGIIGAFASFFLGGLDSIIEKRRKTPSFSYGDISRNMVSV